MYCKKCGTEQKDGQKFCPKCGEPFLDENGKPYLKGIRKDVQDAKEKLTSKAGELTQQGKKLVEEKKGVLTSKVDELTQQSKKLVDEKVQPHLNEKIDELKRTDWEGKKNESIKAMEGFFSNTNKLRMATIGVAIIAVLWFFIFNHGFSASWTWWLFAVAFVVAAFYKVEAKDENDALKKARWSLGLAVILGLVLVFHSPNSSALGRMDDEINYKASNSHDEEILLKMSRIYGEINSVLPQVDALYNVHQQFVSQGGNANFSPAWGKWQDCQNRIMKLWDEYIGLARQLDDSDDIIEDAKERKRKMNKAFNEMFVPHY